MTSRQRLNQVRNRLAQEPSLLGIAQDALPGACKHTGRVRPVVWHVTPDREVPATVVCEQCWRPIDADAVAYTSYAEGEDGWYAPSVERDEP